ncbi:FAD-dependent oxidoreductase [Acinetobacter sp. MD2]|uniref:NAD(P)/FAD-dependent oxidoreductase n=1 Tax=Acinetobacter sp. MD2 TaxID=2600066 RepID=UPI002D1EC4C0|nr:FAD-dependent oxidoreductase [Acinetobacter sp. MD2]MEB3767042.1 FAD-binding oxidoreductase [Acinetobacter sp. MD2]
MLKINKPIILEDVEYRPSIHNKLDKEWSWLNPKCADIEQAANYYESSLNEWHCFDALSTDQECDVVVIGGGLLGASTALHLSELGIDTILVEKNRIGSAASGRNGGQLTPGLARWEAAEMLDHMSVEDAKKLWRFTANEAMDLIDEISDKYGLALDRKQGHITAAVHEGHLIALTQGADARKFLGEDHTKIVGQHEVHNYVNSEAYHGGLIDYLGGQIHPLALTRGLIYGFNQNGGQVFEQTEVIELKTQADGIYVKTAQGVIKARKSVVLAVHHASFKLLESHNHTTIPLFTYVCTTSPLEIDLKELIPADYAVYDTQFALDFYRGVSKNRLLFGGEGTGSCWNEHKAYQYLLGRIHHVFPQLKSVDLDFVWSGETDLTYNGATDCRKFGEKYPIYAVQGWSGHGVAQTVRIGKAIAHDFIGVSHDYEMLTKIPHKDILFGRELAPFAIPLAKSAYEINAFFNPAKLISF